jgi:hypothetical protein
MGTRAQIFRHGTSEPVHEKLKVPRLSDEVDSAPLTGGVVPKLRKISKISLHRLVYRKAPTSVN